MHDKFAFINTSNKDFRKLDRWNHLPPCVNKERVNLRVYDFSKVNHRMRISNGKKRSGSNVLCGGRKTNFLIS